MKHMTKLLTLTTAMALSGVASAGNISGTTDFQVDIPEVLVLYHWDNAVLDFKDLAVAVNDGSTQTKANALLADAAHTINTASVATTSVPTGSTTGLSNDVSVKLENSWAVRSIAAVDKVTLGVAVQKENLYAAGDTTSGSVAVVSSAKLSSTGTGVVAGTTPAELKIPSKWSATSGDIDFTLDLSGVTKAGVHKTAATSTDALDVFKLTLTGSP